MSWLFLAYLLLCWGVGGWLGTSPATLGLRTSHAAAPTSPVLIAEDKQGQAPASPIAARAWAGFGLSPIPVSRSLSIALHLGVGNQENGKSKTLWDAAPGNCLLLPDLHPYQLASAGRAQAPRHRVRSQGRSLSAAPSIPGPTPAPRRTCPPASLGERLGSIFIPARRDEAAPGGTETLLGPPSHQTPMKAGFAPKSPALGPPNAVAGFVCLCFGCRESPRWLIKGFNGPWSRLICWEAAVRR